MSWPLEVTSDSPEMTRWVAAQLAQACSPGDVLLLIGELGAGKTAFAQGFAAALGVEGPVTSPTFTLVRQYHCGANCPVAFLIHADLYRTTSLGEVEDLALLELVEDQAIALIEWGDMGSPVLGQNTISITIVQPDDAQAGPDERRISITGQGTWSQRGDELARLLVIGSEPVAP